MHTHTHTHTHTRARARSQVGRWGGPGPKVVALPTAGRCESLVVSPIPVNEQDDDWNDTFEVHDDSLSELILLLFALRYIPLFSLTDRPLRRSLRNIPLLSSLVSSRIVRFVARFTTCFSSL
jgi:hypothetical protein